MDTAAPKDIKNTTKTQQIEYLTNLLNLRCGELDQIGVRERAIYEVLGGRFDSELPLDCARRAANERDTLANKVLAKDSALKQSELINNQMRIEVGKLQGKIDAILAIAESAAS